MSLSQFAEIFLSFCIYSFLGWVCETIYCSVPKGHFVNRGILAGPVCPIYGFGALLVLYLLHPFLSGNDALTLAALFLAAVVVTSALEYATSVLLEKLFHAQWWDYSKRFCNIHGRVCLKNSLLFGVAATIVARVINPAVRGLIALLPPVLAVALCVILAAALAADLAVSVRDILRLSEKAEQLAAAREELRQRVEAYRAQIMAQIGEHPQEELLDLVRRVKEAAARHELRFEGADELRERLEKVSARVSELGRSRGGQRRLLEAFPGLRSRRHEGFERLREAWARQSQKKK